MARPVAVILSAGPPADGTLRKRLERAGLEVVETRRRAEALRAVRERPVAVFLADATLAGRGLLEEVGRVRPEAIPIALAGAEAGGSALEAIRAGAFDVLAARAAEEDVRLLAERALRQHAVVGELARLRRGVTGSSAVPEIGGWSPSTVELRARLRRLGPTGASVAFVGEEGTGRELAARALHALSDAAGAFVVARGGSFDAPGLLKRAAAGTLLVAEPAELSQEAQEALAAALRGAGSRPRLVTKSRTSIVEAVHEGRLLGELGSWLAEELVRVVALRERPEDIAPIARRFIDRIRELNRLPPIRLAPESLGILERYPWPGNVRELLEVMEHAVILASEGRIEPRHLPERIESQGRRGAPAGSAPARFRDAKRRVVDSFERAYLADLMGRCGGNVTAAAVEAGMLRSALQRLLRKHELRSVDFRSARPPELDS